MFNIDLKTYNNNIKNNINKSTASQMTCRLMLCFNFRKEQKGL